MPMLTEKTVAHYAAAWKALKKARSALFYLDHPEMGDGDSYSIERAKERVVSLTQLFKKTAAVCGLPAL
jgi:hypothetical protein